MFYSLWFVDLRCCISLFIFLFFQVCSDCICLQERRIVVWNVLFLYDLWCVKFPMCSTTVLSCRWWMLVSSEQPVAMHCPLFRTICSFAMFVVEAMIILWRHTIVLFLSQLCIQRVMSPCVFPIYILKSIGECCWMLWCCIVFIA